MHLLKQIIRKILVHHLIHQANIIIRKKLRFVINVDIKADILRILVAVLLKEVINKEIKGVLIFCEFVYTQTHL